MGVSLNPEQRALLQLLCERGQSYADISGLLGISEDQVRERTRATLEALGGRNPDEEVDLTDYLVGQADPIGRADAVRQIQSDAGTRELAELISTKITAIAPEAKLPRLPEARGERKRAAAGPVAKSVGGSSRGPRRPKLPGRLPGRSEPSVTGADVPDGAGSGADAVPDERFPTRLGHARLIAAGVGSAIILLFVILAVAGAFSSDDGAASAEAEISDAQRETVAEALGIPPEQVTAEDVAGFDAQRETTPVTLQPVGGSGVAGRANFDVANTTLFADLTLDGLDPNISDKARYILWLVVNDTRAPAGYPVAELDPGSNGRIQEQYPIPAPVASAVAGAAQFVAVTESGTRELADQIKTAEEDGVPIIPLTGETLARGDIPLVEEQPAAEG